MSRVTSKLQLTIPRAIALRFGIRPGDEVRWEVQARGALMIRPGDGDTAGGAGSVGEGGAFPGIAAPGARTAAGIRDPAERVAHFDRETARIEALLAGDPDPAGEAAEAKRRREVEERRGWSREDLYGDRGHPRPR